MDQFSFQISNIGHAPAVIPDRAGCLAIIAESDMLPNILEHSLLVAAAAMVLARGHLSVGFPLNLSLVEAGALLHDITKTRSIVTRERHDESGEEFLVELGYPEVGKIVGQHVHYRPDPADSRWITEGEIVCYADKRVKHDQLVDLEERFRDLEERYGRTEEHKRLIRANFESIRLMEQKLFSALDFNPEDLEACILETS